MTNPLPRYYELLDAAHAAHQAVDDFDVVSSNPESQRIFRDLVRVSTVAQLALIQHFLEQDVALMVALVDGLIA